METGHTPARGTRRRLAAMAAKPKGRALTALALVVPAPSIGLLFALFLAPGWVGRVVFGLSKLWVLAVPALWALRVDRLRKRAVWPNPRGMLAGLATGLAMFAVILGLYFTLGGAWLDVAALRERLVSVGFTGPRVYLFSALYWTFLNSLLEEYVWRWFVTRQCQRLVPFGRAVLLSAGLFTIHHVVGLAAYPDFRIGALAVAGIFVGGLIWSWLYAKYGSVWPGYLSHLLADAAILAAGWDVLFG